MNNNPIGILDSGVGGLTIWKEIVNLLPNESTIYIGDSKNCPYGTRSTEEICMLAKRLVQFLVEKKCKLIVVACNTITVNCLDMLRSEFSLPIVGIVPVVKTAAAHTTNKKIGILSTLSTANSEYQKNLIAQFANSCEVINQGTDKLVPLVENGQFEKSAEVLPEILQPFIDADIDTLALGCSHFPFLKEHMQKVLGKNVEILDSGAAIARQVERVLQKTSGTFPHYSDKAERVFYTTGESDQFNVLLQKVGYNGSAMHIDL